MRAFRVGKQYQQHREDNLDDYEPAFLFQSYPAQSGSDYCFLLRPLIICKPNHLDQVG
jgi:hypothetical protein